MVRIVEADEDVDDPQPPNPSSTHSSPDSSHNHRNNRRSPPSPPPQASSPSSISSDHTFHGFSPVHEPASFPSPSPSPPLSTPPSNPPNPLPDPVIVPVPAVANRLIRDQPEVVTKSEPDAETGFAGEGEAVSGESGGVSGERGGVTGERDGGTRRRVGRAPPPRAVRRATTEKAVRGVALGLRVCEFLVCLVSFSVMAADKNRGWAFDSFDRYIEFRYSISVNIIGFAYSALQGLDLVLQLTTKRMYHSGSKLRCCFDFAMDQILAYLLLSASSSAFTRVDDWISNWGQDKFPAMATASVGVSFLAFAAFAMSSLVSGYILCTQK